MGQRTYWPIGLLACEALRRNGCSPTALQQRLGLVLIHRRTRAQTAPQIPGLLCRSARF
jgi:septum formation topological specificity factor MinE